MDRGGSEYFIFSMCDAVIVSKVSVNVLLDLKRVLLTFDIVIILRS